MEQTPERRLLRSCATPILNGLRTSLAAALQSRGWTASHTLFGLFFADCLRIERENRLFQTPRRSTIPSRPKDYQPLAAETEMISKRILIADDEELIRAIIRMALGTAYEISEAADGEEAWQKLTMADPEFDLLILDWNMPLLNGKELLERIMARDPNASVLVLSGRFDCPVEANAQLRVMNKPMAEHGHAH